MMSFFRSSVQQQPGTEENEVMTFLQHSYNFKQLLQLYDKHKNSNLNDITNIVESIQRAKSFNSIKLALSRFDQNDCEGAVNSFEIVVVPKIVYAAFFFCGFVDDRANVAYYAVNLFSEVDNKIKENTYYCRRN